MKKNSINKNLKRCCFGYLQFVELLSLVAGNFCIDELGEEKFSQLTMLIDTEQREGERIKRFTDLYLIKVMGLNSQAA